MIRILSNIPKKKEADFLKLTKYPYKAPQLATCFMMRSYTFS